MAVSYEIEGKIYGSLREVARVFSVNYSTLNGRLVKGIPIYDAVYGDRWTWDCIRYLECIYGSVEELSAQTGVSREVIITRLNLGWLVWDAINKPTYLIDEKQYSFLHEIADEYGILYSTLYSRMFIGNRSLYDAVYFDRPVTFRGARFSDRIALCEALEINPSRLNHLLIHKGMTLEHAADQLAAKVRLRQLRMLREKWERERRIQEAVNARMQRFLLLQRFAIVLRQHFDNIQAIQALHIQRIVFVLQHRVDRIQDARELAKKRTERMEQIQPHEDLLLAVSYRAIPYRRYIRTQTEGADHVYDVVNYRVNRGWSLLKAVTASF